MQIRSTLHKIRAGLADFCAIEHQANVIRLGVFATLLGAIHRGSKRRLMTIIAELDAIEHVLRIVGTG